LINFILFRISFGIVGRYTLSEIVAFSLSIMLVLIWIITGHWLFMDGKNKNCSLIFYRILEFYLVIATGLCISFIALVRLPNLKVSALLLFGLVIYDVFWVYFSHYIFTTNVMVRVATREAENPVK
jgi:signal peptide peptidase-like protein 3